MSLLPTRSSAARPTPLRHHSSAPCLPGATVSPAPALCAAVNTQVPTPAQIARPGAMAAQQRKLGSTVAAVDSGKEDQNSCHPWIHPPPARTQHVSNLHPPPQASPCSRQSRQEPAAPKYSLQEAADNDDFECILADFNKRQLYDPISHFEVEPTFALGRGRPFGSPVIVANSSPGQGPCSDDSLVYADVLIAGMDRDEGTVEIWGR